MFGATWPHKKKKKKNVLLYRRRATIYNVCRGDSWCHHFLLTPCTFFWRKNRGGWWKKEYFAFKTIFQLKISENFILRAANWFGASKKRYNCSLDTQRYHHQMRLERKDEKRIKRCCSPPSDSTRQHYLLPRSLVYFYLFSILPSFTLDSIKPL